MDGIIIIRREKSSAISNWLFDSLSIVAESIRTKQ